MEARELLALAAGLTDRARNSGADAAEAIVSWQRGVETSIENGDIHAAETADETVFGLRVLTGSRLGFTTANGSEPALLDRCVEEALAQARAMPEDPFNGLPEPLPAPPVAGLHDPRIAELDVAATTEAAVAVLDRIVRYDKRVRVDSGSVSTSTSATALVSTTGVELFERQSVAHGYVFGMAVDGDDVASFDYEGDATRDAGRLGELLEQAADRFAAKCVAGLGAGKGRSFKGAIVLSPEAVGEFLLPNLIAMISADAVRKGRSRLADRLGSKIAADQFTLVDDGSIAGGIGSSAFDREGIPPRRTVLVDQGVLATFLYNHYEAQAAGNGRRSTGHATGSASSLPGIGPSHLELAAGKVAAADLAGDGPVIYVGRFSGSSNPVSGEFSGVVKNGFLVEAGARRPVREVLIAGNLFDALQQISAVSSERRLIGGTRLLPALRIDGISVTAA